MESLVSQWNDGSIHSIKEAYCNALLKKAETDAEAASLLGWCERDYRVSVAEPSPSVMYIFCKSSYEECKQKLREGDVKVLTALHEVWLDHFVKPISPKKEQDDLKAVHATFSKAYEWLKNQTMSGDPQSLLHVKHIWKGCDVVGRA